MSEGYKFCKLIFIFEQFRFYQSTLEKKKEMTSQIDIENEIYCLKTVAGSQ